MSIREKLLPFFEELPYSDVKVAQRAISYLILLDNVKLYDEMVLLFESQEQVKEFLKPVKSCVTDSYLSRGIWRAVLRSIINQSSLEEASAVFQVDPSDVYFCWDGLTSRDKQEFVEFAREGEFLLDPLSAQDLKALMSRLAKFCKNISYRKLRFIHNSDNAVLMEDIYSELQMKALKMVRHYEHLSKDGKHDLLKIENYVKSGITNHVTNLINYHTTKKRARISNITKSCGECIACKEGKTAKCRMAVHDFQITTLRLDPPKPNYIGTICNTLVSEVKTPDKVFEEKELFTRMKSGVDSKIAEFLNIIMDKSPSEDFEDWLRDCRHIRIEEIVDDRKITNLALEYLSLDKSLMKSVLSKQFSKVGVR